MCSNTSLGRMTDREHTEGDNPQTSIPGALSILANSLAMRLTSDEIEWLCKKIMERTEQKRCKAVGGQLPVLAGYRDAWEPGRDAA
jgi:hypothetical protein